MGWGPVAWERAMVVLTEHPSARCFHDPWGVWWVVYDHRKQCPPIDDSPVRYFVGHDRRRCRYTFGDGEWRQLTPRALVTQRDWAQHVPKGQRSVGP